MKENAFLTGSRVYGTPSLKSDYDLVVLLSKDDACLLRMFDQTEEPYGDSATYHIRFGQLDLIVCNDENEFENWKKARDFLKKEAPVNKVRAILVHRQCLGRK
jgi:predicted nucleotidyltransferase